jgi:hypothetical protein
MIPGVEGHSCGVHPFSWCFGLSRLARCLTLADSEVQARALEQLPFLWIALQHRPEIVGSSPEVVPLERLDTSLVDRDRFVEARLPRRRWRWSWWRRSGHRF